MPAKKEISLLPEENNVNSFSARLVNWLITVGRYVIVFTELIVVCAFLSRFWLDRTNSDLSETVRQQKAILASTGDFEKDYSLLQKRLVAIKNFYSNQPEFQPKIESLVESTPLDITFNNLTITRDSKSNDITSTLDFSAYKETSVVDFITNLILNPNISTVDISNIEKKTRDNKYNVSLSLIFSSSKK